MTLKGRSGDTTTCEHSQELTPGLLELIATGVFTPGSPGINSDWCVYAGVSWNQ